MRRGFRHSYRISKHYTVSRDLFRPVEPSAQILRSYVVSPRLHSDNQLFQMARQGQRFPSALAAIALVPVLVVVMIASQVGMRVVFRSFLGSGATADSMAELLGFSAILAGLWCVVRYWSRRPFWTLGFERSGLVKCITRGALVAVLMMAATAALILLSGGAVEPGEIQTRGVVALGGGLMSLLATTTQSSAEEALFRGWLLPVLGVRYGGLAAVASCSLIFTLAHATTGPTPLGWVNLFLFGTFCALLALAEGGLWGACAWHSIWNWTQGSLLGFRVDRTVRFGLLASIRTTGPESITGGSFGPEGGLVVTAILLAGIATLLIPIHREASR